MGKKEHCSQSHLYQENGVVITKEQFLFNGENKESLITLIDESLEKGSISVKQAREDVATVCQVYTHQEKVILVGIADLKVHFPH